jgi:gliding motility-associated-like protein
VSIARLYNWVKFSPFRVIFLLCHFFALSGIGQALPFTWAKSAGAGSDQEALGVTADANGNVYATGYIKGSNNSFSSVLITSAGGGDIFLAKYDLDGNIIWAKTAGGTGDDQGNSIAVDNAGNIYICGYIKGTATFYGTPNIVLTGPGNADVFVAKYNAAGNVLWAKRAGSSGDGIAKSVCTNGTDVFITGQFDGTCSFGALPNLTSSNKDAFIASYNAATGAEQWAIKAGSSSDDIGSGIAVDASGVYVTGTYDATITFQNMSGTLTNNGAGDVFVVKYNLSGTGVWKRKAGGSGDDHETALAISGPYVYVTGHFHSTMSFYDTGPVVATLPNASGEDAFVAQWNATTGNYAWSRSENGTGADRGIAIAANPAGDVFVTGNFNGTLPCGSGPAITSNGEDIFVTKYNAAGTFLWGKKAGGSAEDRGQGIVAPDNTSAYVVGTYKSAPAAFDALSISTVSNFDIFTAKLGCTCTIADAGGNQTLCTSTATLAGNTPIIGAGMWTLISGAGIITSPSSPTSTVSGLAAGANVFQWTITNSICPASTFDQVTINVDSSPTTANAGLDQSICTSSTTLAGNTPTVGTGTWTRLSGSGTATTPSSPTSTVTGLTLGSSVYQWSITNGVCPASTDVVTLTVDPNPTTANAGIDQTICSPSSVFAGNTPTIGTGAWTLISGTGVITNAASPSSPVNGLSAGANIFRWTITNGSCPSSSDQVTINVDASPTTANAGPDQTVCSSSAVFAGNIPAIGSGAWTLVSGTGTVSVPSSATSTVTGLSVGANVFRWTISNGTCPSSFDNVTITRDATPTTANAGADQTICSTSTTLAGNVPSIGSGTWTLISGTGVIANPAAANSAVNGLSVGANVFRWTITNGTCPASSDQVTINVDPFPTAPNAGPDQSVCSAVATLAGNTPTAGTGFWSLISGTGTITAPTSATSGVTGLSVGANVFRWTITSGTCPSSFDEVTITRDANPTIANAGTDQTLCTSSTTLAGNLPAIGTGMWTLISGTGNLTTPSSNTSGVTGLTTGAAVFRWTISNGTCPSSSDQVTINHDANPTIANAGTDQTLCSSSASFAGNIPSTGNGSWTVISGTGIVSTPSSASSTVNNLSVGANVFQWTITNGTCPSSSDQVTINVDANPTTANAGPDQTLCTSSTALAGNAPAIGTGTWTLISGTGNLTTPSSNTSGVTGLVTGAAVFEWRISNGTCPSSSDQVTINHDASPTIANAGTDQTICSSSATFAGNLPSTGNGLWTLISGTGIITTASSASSTVNGLSVGANTFQWTITNGTCPSSFDQVTINVDANPTTANAGNDQTICTSSTAFTGNTPAIGTGVWTLISGTGTIVTASSATSSVNGLSVGANVFEWTISNGTCPSSSNQVTINVDANPAVAVAGPDQTLCATTTSLAGNIPSPGTGMWTLISGSGTIVTPNSATSVVNGLAVGANIFQWTTTNGTCPASSDQVTIYIDANPTTANAGIDQTICSSASSLAGNTPVIGSGTWTLISGPATITAPSSNTSAVTGLATGANVFEWTISNGACPSTSDQVTINVDANPSLANAGTDQTICASSSLLSGNIPSTGNGVWTLISGTGIISTPAVASSSVTGLSVGANIFQWTISNGTCPASTDQVIINIDANPSVANAGNDQTICNSTAGLSGNIPLTGNGTWNVVSGAGIISNPAQPSSAVTNLATGTNVFEWIITNGVCPSSHDTVSIFVDQYPTIANAGADQQICSSSSVMNGNIPSVGTGSWALISSTGNFTNAALPNTAVTNLAAGANTFEWIISNGACPASHDTVLVFVDNLPSPANAGSDQLICSSSSTLQAANPSTGTGTWYVLSGPSSVTNVLLPNSTVTNLAPGTNEFKWVVINGVCPLSADTIQIYVDSLPTAADAGVAQTICTDASSLNANIPLVGSGQWFVINSAASVVNATQSSTAVNGLSLGQNSFEWVVSNGVCPSSHDTVVISVDENPSQAVAGTDNMICDPLDTLHGNIPLVGSGQWFSINSPPQLGTPNAATTTVSNLVPGLNPFEWVISNGVCPVTRDTVLITYTLRPSAPDAGPDLFECAHDITMQGEIPSIGNGYWTNISNTGSFADPTDPNSILNNVPDGSYLYTWTTSNLYCASRPDTVVVTVYSPPSLADAGEDQLIHTSATTLNAVACDTGIGTWSFVSGSGQIEDPNDPASRVTNLANGINMLRWTTSNGVCATREDDMQIECKALIIPTGYSPNADGTNDVFEIEGLLEYSNVSLEIFNRWGNRVYMSPDYKNDWNGVGSTGEILPDDIYYYVLKLDDGTAFNGYIAIKRKTS